MNYKKVELEGLPEYELGTAVQAWNDNPSDKVIGIYGGYNGLGEKREHLILFGGGEYAWYRNIRPVPAWTPEKGEIVAVWDETFRFVAFRIYAGGGKCYASVDVKRPLRKQPFIARIPDGKRIFGEKELTPEWFKANSDVMEA